MRQQHKPTTAGASGLRELFSLFAPFGLTAFGGPGAHIGMLQRELVERRGWMEVHTFAELVAFCQLLLGGGYVLLPLLESWVIRPGYITATQFLDGLGLVQALPGALLRMAQ